MPVIILSNRSNYFETTGRLCFYLEYKAKDFNVYIFNENKFKFFKYKTKLENGVAHVDCTALEILKMKKLL